MKKFEHSFMANMFSDICNKLGLELEMGPKLGAYGQIKDRLTGKRISFYDCCFDVNPYGSSITTRNKGLVRLILESEKIVMPNGKYFSFDTDKYSQGNLEDIKKDVYNFMKKLSFPIMVKGADLHRGSCIFKVNSKQELTEAVQNVFSMTRGVIIEEFIDFPTYRILVFDGEVIACYGKNPFQIIGDGVSTASQLIRRAEDISQENSIGTNFDKMRDEIKTKLKQNKYTEESIVPKDKKVILCDSASISKGGVAIDYTDFLCDEFKQYCKNICKLLNLKICGIDIISKDIINAPKDTYLLEANSSPCLETYSLLGEKQYRIIEDLMEKIINKGFRTGD